ncbi:MAG: RNA polymerase sigma factor [Armatimonadetes bacterium]|nr:RNA polymerase sigma factor [Armatimonadota bacterium]
MTEQSAEITARFGALREMADTGERALEELYDIYARSLFRYALALTCSADDAEDAVQEVFVRVAREWKQFARVANPRAYLFIAARNAAYGILRSRHRREALHEAARAEFIIEPSCESGPDAAALCEAMADLPVEQREVLVLKVYDDMTFKEIAETVGVSINTITSRYRYAIDKLRTALEVSEDE